MPCTIKNPANIDMSDLTPHIQGMYDYFDQSLSFQKPPTVILGSDPNNQSSVLGKTAYYDPTSLEIHIYTDGRHPKDMLRSIAHELIHHHQNMEDRLDVGGYSGPGYYLENDKLRAIEHEAMLEGNKLLREYEDTIKKESKDMSLKEWKNNELNQLLMKKFGILKENAQPDFLNKDGDAEETTEDAVTEGQEELKEIGKRKNSPRDNRGEKGTRDNRDDRLREDEELNEGDIETTEDEMNQPSLEENSGNRRFTANESLKETVQKALKIAQGK